jgi:curved DNA-binding protein
MAVTYKDYYAVLGVPRTATEEEIRKAFRKKAREFHPDVNKSPGAEDRYKELNEAYEVLKDPEKRKKYDTLGANWRQGEPFTPPPGWEGAGMPFGQGAGGFDFSDFFRTIFGGMGNFEEVRTGQRGSRRQARGEDSEAEIEVSLEEAAHGGRRHVGFETPHGRKDYEVAIPKGVAEGTRIRMAGQGAPGRAGGPPGDLYLKVRLKKDPRFTVDCHDLRSTLDLAPWEAALGCEVPVQTLDGIVTLKVPPGVSSGQTLRLRDKGLPTRGGSVGDLLVTVRIVTPKNPTEKEQELWKALAEASGFEPRKH